MNKKNKGTKTTISFFISKDSFIYLGSQELLSVRLENSVVFNVGYDQPFKFNEYSFILCTFVERDCNAKFC